MHRIDHETRALDLFGAGKDGFTGGDPALSIAPTTVTPEWANSVQEELAAVVEAFGPLDKSTMRQFAQSMAHAFGLIGASTIEERLAFPGGMADMLDAVSDDEATIALIATGSGTDARVYSAPDGWTFEPRELGSATTNELKAIAWAPGPRLFVIVGGGGEIQTSPDAVTWTKQTQALAYAGEFYALAVSLTCIVAIGSGNEIQTSEDGVTWTKRVSASSASNSFDVTYSDVAQRFLIVDQDRNAFTSPDGVTWTAVGSAPSAGQYGPGPAGFIAVNAPELKISTSPDGASWDTRVAVGNWQPSYVSQNGVITGRPSGSLPSEGFCSGVSALRRPRLVATHLGIPFNDVIRTQVAWVAKGAGGKVYVSQPLAF